MPTAIKEKTIGVRFPAPLHNYLSSLADREYKSVSEVIREIVVEKVESEFTLKEWAMIEAALQESFKEKGVNWRKA